VDALVHASDNFNLLVAITLALLAAAAAAGIALGAGALHPLWIYLILAACGSCTVFGAVMALRENRIVRRVRAQLRETAENYYVPSPFTLSSGASATPTVTLGEAATSPATAMAATGSSDPPDPGAHDQPSESDADTSPPD